MANYFQEVLDSYSGTCCNHRESLVLSIRRILVNARLALPVSILFASASLFAQQPAINTFPNWNGSSFISSFGVVNTATYGQTINVSATTPLNSFSFQISCNAAVSFRGHVYA
jgi:hypothetical protein